MNYATRFIWILAGFMLFTAFAESDIFGRLRRGFEALEVYNYFKAKELFYRALKNDSVPAAYGLSVIYGRNDNPFFQIDSAFKFIKIAKRNYPSLSEDDKEDYSVYGVDSSAIANQLHSIDSLFYRVALAKDSVNQWNDFITNHFSKPYHAEAIRHRNQRAFAIASRQHTSAAYAEFLKKHPKAVQAPAAKRKFQKRLFNEQTVAGTVSSYQDFIRKNPRSPYVSDAEDRIYAIATKDGRVEDYVRFIQEFPGNGNIGEAWHALYRLELNQLTARSISAFSLKYPDYPFMDQLQEEFEYATTPYYPIMVDSLWGFIDEQGVIRVPPKYDWVERYSENMALVGKDGQVAFINKAGELITDFELDDAYTFKDGYAVVENNGKAGVINRLGQLVIPFQYRDVGEYSDGLFYAEDQDGKYGYIDNKGEIIIPFILDNASNFSDGYAVVEKNGATGVIDKKGMLIVNFIYDWVEPFENDIKSARVRINGRFGLIDRHGILVADTVYNQIGDFSNGLALAANDKRYGFLTILGDTAIPFIYSYNPAVLKKSVFINQHARVYQKGKVGIIDTSGTKIFPAIFEDIGNYIGKLIPVKRHGKWGYADLGVNLAIDYSYTSAGNFKDGLAVVSRKGKYGIIDTLGNLIIDLKFNSLKIIDSLVLVSDTAFGLINLEGKELVPLIFSDAKRVNDRIIQFESPQGMGPQYYAILRQEFIWRRNL